MRNSAQRDVYYLEATVEAEPRFGAIHTMQSLMDEISGLVFDGTTGHVFSNKTRSIHIEKIQQDAQHDIFWLLVHANDELGPNASFAKMGGGERREELKKEGEGRPLSCHIAISLRESRRGSNSYLVLLEECSLLKRERMEWYLNILFKRAVKGRDDYKVPDPSGASVKGSPKLIPYCNVLRVDGLVSDEFDADLKAGKLRGITLEVSATSQAPVGDGRTVRPNRRSLSLSAIGEWKINPFQRVSDALNFARTEKYRRAKVHFSAAAGNPSTATLDVYTGKVVEDGYIKRGRLKNPAATWAEAESEINLLIQHQMRKMLLEERGDFAEEAD